MELYSAIPENRDEIRRYRNFVSLVFDSFFVRTSKKPSFPDGFLVTNQ